jgi:hypothetical protein
MSSELSYDPGKLWGDRRDPTLQRESVKGLDDARLGRLLRGLGRTGAVYREAERSAHEPPELSRDDRSDETFEERLRQSKEFHRHVNLVDGLIGATLVDVVAFANTDPNRWAMYSRDAVFKEGQPVLYYEHWGTEDLDDPGRDSVELQRFIGINGHLATEAGKTLAHSILDEVLDGGGMSPGNVPTGSATFNTVPKEIFVPFIRAEPASS